jgi:hypothetical protein
MNRVYILSNSDELASQCDYGPGWGNMWKDPDGNRLLPFTSPPDGHTTMTVDEARLYVLSFENNELQNV